MLTKSIFFVITPLVAIGLLIWNNTINNVEKPDYQIIKTENNIEIRHYKPMLIAEVIESGDRKTAISNGFNVLADYIFGNNTTSQKINMTAPVSQTQSEKIEMTAPVLQKPLVNSWKIQFTMPKKYQIETLPKPNNKRVNIIKQKKSKRVVIQFSGNATNSKIKQNEKKLLNYIKKNNLEVTSKPFYAFYNSPWTPPFLKRNEIMLLLK